MPAPGQGADQVVSGMVETRKREMTGGKAMVYDANLGFTVVHGEDKKTIKALKEKLTEHEHKIEHLKFELEFEREAVKRVTQEKLAEINAAEAKLRQQYADDKLESFKDGMKAAVAMMKP